MSKVSTPVRIFKQQGSVSSNNLKTANGFGDKYVTIGELPESIRILAMQRTMDYRGDIETIADLLNKPIRSAFSFTNSFEGAKFWLDVVRGEIDFNIIKPTDKRVIKLDLRI